MTTFPDVPLPNGLVRAEKVRETARQVRDLIEHLDGFTFLTPEENIRLSTAATVSDRFLGFAANAIENSRSLSATSFATPATLRDTVIVSEALDYLVEEMTVLSRGVRETRKAMRAEAGTEALRVYGVAQKLSRPRDSEESVRWLERMRREVKRGRKAKAGDVEPPDGDTTDDAPSAGLKADRDL